MGLNNLAFDWTAGIQQPSSQPTQTPAKQAPPPVQYQPPPGSMWETDPNYKAYAQKIYGEVDPYREKYTQELERLRGRQSNQGIANLDEMAAAAVLGLPGAYGSWNLDQRNKYRALAGLDLANANGEGEFIQQWTPPGFYGPTLADYQKEYSAFSPEQAEEWSRLNGGAPVPFYNGNPGPSPDGGQMAAPGSANINPLIELLSGGSGIQAGRDNPFGGRNWQDQMAQLAPLMQLIQALLGGR